MCWYLIIEFVPSVGRERPGPAHRSEPAVEVVSPRRLRLTGRPNGLIAIGVLADARPQQRMQGRSSLTGVPGSGLPVRRRKQRQSRLTAGESVGTAQMAFDALLHCTRCRVER